MGLLAGDQELGGVAVGLQRVGGDHPAGQLQVALQRLEPGDLIEGAVDLALGEHSAGGVVHRGEELDLPAVASGAAQRLAIDRDRTSTPAGTVAVSHPGADHGGEQVRVHFVEPPLEGLWWADDMNDFIAGNRDKLKWRLMIVTANWVDQELFDQAVATASERLGEPPRSLRLERFAEGPSVQIMHLGPNSQEVATLARLHSEFLPEHGLVPNGHHHEVYLTDPNRVAPEKRRTVLRQPVRHVM